MAGSPLKRARREQREADQLATFETTRRNPLPAPHDTPADYAPSLIDELLALSDEGYSLAEIAAHWSTSEETIEQWRKAHLEFDEALNRARAREKAWWLARARKAIRDDNNRFPAGAWSHVMRARFPEYADQKGVTVNLNLSDLVVINRRQPPEPLHERVAESDKPLIEWRTVRLAHSLTASDEAKGSSETTHDAPTGG